MFNRHLASCTDYISDFISQRSTIGQSFLSESTFLQNSQLSATKNLPEETSNYSDETFTENMPIPNLKNSFSEVKNMLEIFLTNLKYERKDELIYKLVSF